jgi:hypothetical protein
MGGVDLTLSQDSVLLKLILKCSVEWGVENCGGKSVRQAVEGNFVLRVS